jgi:hypothetical protein
MPTPSSDRQRQIFLLFLLALLAAGKVIQPCLDWDSWWHLRVGQFVTQQWRLPDHEPFSQIGQEQHLPWIAYSWLYELLLYGCFKSGGAAGVLLLRYLLVMLSWGGIAWFLMRHARNAWIGLGLLALVTMSLRPFSPEWPWHFTIFFTMLTLHAVIRVREGASARRFAGLPFIYVLWANIHIQFVMGFAVLGLAWLTTVIERFVQKRPERGAVARQLFWLGLACATATLLTPFHVKLYAVIWEYATQTKALGLVMELQPPDYAQWYNWPLIVLAVLAGLTTRLRGLRAWDIVLLCSALFFSMRMQRDLWYGVLACCAVVLHERDEREGAHCLFPAWLIALLSLAAVGLVSAAWELGLSKGKTVAAEHRETYPVEAAEVVRQRRLPGPLLNNFDWGGYLIWALPEYPVSIDGRTNLYGEQRLQRSFDAWAGQGWEDYPDLLRAGVIIAPNNRGDKKFPLTEILREHNDRWRVEYEDDTAVIFVPVR